MTVTYNPGGKLDGIFEGSGQIYTDTGKWWVPEAGKVCQQWNRWQDRRETCFKMVKRGAISDHEKAGKKKLTEKEIRAELIGHSIYGRTAFNSRWTDSRVYAVYFNPNGKYWFSCCEHNDWGFIGGGKWKIVKGKLCQVRKRDGREFCRAYFRDGKKLLTDTAEIFSIEKGDKF